MARGKNLDYILDNGLIFQSGFFCYYVGESIEPCSFIFTPLSIDLANDIIPNCDSCPSSVYSVYAQSCLYARWATPEQISICPTTASYWDHNCCSNVALSAEPDANVKYTDYLGNSGVDSLITSCRPVIVPIIAGKTHIKLTCPLTDVWAGIHIICQNDISTWFNANGAGFSDNVNTWFFTPGGGGDPWNFSSHNPMNFNMNPSVIAGSLIGFFSDGNQMLSDIMTIGANFSSAIPTGSTELVLGFMDEEAWWNNCGYVRAFIALS